ncbi:DUF4192 domain-containing protein [Streptoalloteichus hindustanus]|uniref:DUF4192 domain-containing protein n=1 Tax=Streptoalloteichus hindustanus TaxID=2017 RepID=A0A1M5B6L1_STRHI|nr:DUF4192 domain-containing protein [Streptoalloteichus hindustanus]SHF38070.1 protein of unknown function [Streptoalloteichus hindustanus]
MTTPPHSRIQLRDPGELVAAVPHLLGFHPEESLVLVTIGGDEPKRLGVCLRTDLVPAEHHRDLAEQLLQPLLSHRTRAVFLLVVGGGSADPPVHLPGRELVAVVDRVLDGGGVPVLHSLWTPEINAGAPWCCYHEPACAGTVPDPATTATAAAAAVAGWVTFGTREELAAQLVPEDAETMARRSALLTAAGERAEQDRALSGSAASRRDLTTVRQAVRAFADGRLALDDETVVRLAVALSDPRVRDACLSWGAGDEGLAAERLWLGLVRATPPPERAEPASLLAISSYVRGDGALAGIAVEVAEEACPGHRVATLLRTALQIGVPPARVAVLAADAATDARTLIEEDDSW